MPGEGLCWFYKILILVVCREDKTQGWRPEMMAMGEGYARGSSVKSMSYFAYIQNFYTVVYRWLRMSKIRQSLNCLIGSSCVSNISMCSKRIRNCYFEPNLRFASNDDNIRII